jgi:hypothetical protein
MRGSREFVSTHISLMTDGLIKNDSKEKSSFFPYNQFLPWLMAIQTKPLVSAEYRLECKLNH